MILNMLTGGFSYRISLIQGKAFLRHHQLQGDKGKGGGDAGLAFRDSV